MTLSPLEIDNAFIPELRRAIEDDLSARKMTYYFQIFSGASHGFATRGDPAVESQRGCHCLLLAMVVLIHFPCLAGWAKEECARSVVQWFRRFSG